MMTSASILVRMIVVSTMLFTSVSFAIMNGAPLPKHFKRLAVLNNGCRAVLYDDDILITAAHCYHPWTESTDVAFINMSGADSAGFASEWKLHPDYSRKGPKNDIAVIILDKPIRGAKALPSLGLPMSNPPTGITGMVYGSDTQINWEGKPYDNHRFEARMAPFRVKEVGKGAETGRLVVESVHDDPKSKLCFADSGSPFISELDGKQYLIGVGGGIDLPWYKVPFVKNKCEHSDYEVETSIGFHHDWLIKTIDELRVKHGRKKANKIGESQLEADSGAVSNQEHEGSNDNGVASPSSPATAVQGR